MLERDIDRRDRKFVAALDIGTTTLRCHIVNENGAFISQCAVPTKIYQQNDDGVEIPYDQLWNDTVYTIKTALSNAHLTPADVILGISTQRTTFLTWRKDSGIPFHNFITWKDKRCKDLVSKWNQSMWLKLFHFVCCVLYFFTRNQRFLAGTSLTFSCTHASMRLLWALEHFPELLANISNVMFGTVDTWLLYKLTSGAVFATDVGNASTTGLVDPFKLTWSVPLRSMLGLPLSIFPPILANDCDFGFVHERFFGARIPISSVMADQQASMIGSCCYEQDVLKLTMGTGGFFNIVTRNPYPGANAVYPLICYQLKGDVSYIVETAHNDIGTVILWTLQSGFCASAEETAAMATSVDGNNGVYFIREFNALESSMPISAFVGANETTKQEHFVRAILESIVFRIMIQYALLREEVNNDITKIFVDGGVSKNDFICQLIADMTNLPMERTTSSEMSSLGVAYIAGMNSGIWKSFEELKGMRRLDRIFLPTQDANVRRKQMEEFQIWKEAVQCS